MITIIAIVSTIWFAASVYIATLESDWVESMYSDDSIESYLDRAKLAFLVPPLFIICTIAYWLYKRKQRSNICNDCLYRVTADKNGKLNNNKTSLWEDEQCEL